MSDRTAGRYLSLMGEDSRARLALLACSAALRLTDDTARAAIKRVVATDGFTDRLVTRIKSLGCTWVDWDGAWYLAEDVRAGLAQRLGEEIGQESYAGLRALLAQSADVTADSLAPDGQVTAYESRLWRLEGAFQRTLMPGDAAIAGIRQLTELWRQETPSGKRATAAAADHLAPEIVRQLEKRPPELLFLQGLAARERGDRKAAELYFRSVWEQGGEGDIFAIAAHLFGVLVIRRDPATAERAFQDSLNWYHASHHQGQVWHSLGNLLTRDLNRWDQAERAYRRSLELLHEPEDQGQVWHSLGNLLARNQDRWDQAERAYRTSLELLRDPEDQGQVYASLADGLAKQNKPGTDEEAVECALRAQALHPRVPKTLGVVYRILADVYERQGKTEEAIESLVQLLENNHRLGLTRFDGRIRKRIASLTRRP